MGISGDQGAEDYLAMNCKMQIANWKVQNGKNRDQGFKGPRVRANHKNVSRKAREREEIKNSDQVAKESRVRANHKTVRRESREREGVKRSDQVAKGPRII